MDGLINLHDIQEFKDDVPMRERVFRMEKIMRESPPHVFEVKHHFSKGLYARELFIPKGIVLTGKIHKYANLNIMSKGDLTVLTEDGMVRIQAPFTVVSPPGTKRIAYAHEDTIWTSIHATEETDVAKIEAEVVAQDEADYVAFLAAQKLLESQQ